MRSITMRAGDCFTVGSTVVQVDHTCDDRVRLSVDTAEKISVVHSAESTHSDGELQDRLRSLAQEIISEISEAAPSNSRELLGDFVSELFLSVAKQDIRVARRQKQAEGIAAAKARGVRFGPRPAHLPDNFGEVHAAWRGGQMTLRQAAESCGMTKSTFYSAVVRMEQGKDCAV